MIKSIFITPEQIKGIESSGANHLIVVREGLNPAIWNKLKRLKINLSISINAFGPDGCPASPTAQTKLFSKLQESLKYSPSEIWLDHFRFDGHWEAIENKQIPRVHAPCRFCKGKNRTEVLKNIAEQIKKYLSPQIKLGYFAVPFKDNEVPQLISSLGQDHLVLGEVFDLISPMLYQEMIKEPTDYIYNYVQWLFEKTKRPIFPIIQIQTMPEKLPDTISDAVITSEFTEAIKKPSVGASFFMWAQAVNQNKTAIIRRLFESI